MTKQIIRINASALRNAHCMLKLYRKVIEGYKEPVNGISLEFGSAIHVFTRTMFESSGNIGVALIAAKNYLDKTPHIKNPKKAYLDSTHLLSVCTRLWEWFSVEKNDFEVLATTDGKPTVEITFSNKFYEDDNYIVLLEGTIDMLGKFKGQQGAYAIGDWKSTSSWDWPEYLSGYALSTQLRFYLFNLHLYAKLNPDSLIAEIVKKPVGVFINGIFLNGKDKTGFERSEVFFIKQHELNEFESQLKGFVEELLFFLKHAIIPSRLGLLNNTCTGNFGKCEFFKVCAAPDDTARSYLLKNNYKQEPYTPLRNSEDKV